MNEYKIYENQMIGVSDSSGELRRIKTTDTGRLIVEPYSTIETLETDKSFTFANSAALNTQVTVDFTSSMVRNKCTLNIYNPSTVTALTVKLMAKIYNFSGATRYAFIDSITVPKSQTISGTVIDTYQKIIDGSVIGDDFRLVISNDTALGASDTFTGSVRLRKV